ncbi:MAG TPA: UPF0175 family protein [Bryobacteraceae bacterium]|jgi:uncharacterized protein YqgQ|nr:UPF0175 family protein [Bryobacteraceae bacterium]
MTVTVEIPDQLAEVLIAQGNDLSRAVLEAMALEGYRVDRLSEYDVQQLLGFESRLDVHGFLKEHGVYLNYRLEDLEHDMREADRYYALRADDTRAEQHAR